MGDLGQKGYRSVVSCENELSQGPAKWIYFRSSFSQRHCYNITRDLHQFKCMTFHIFERRKEEWVKNIPSKQNREYISRKRKSIKVCTLPEQLSKTLPRDKDCCTIPHRTYFASGRNIAVRDKMPTNHQLFLFLIAGRIPRGILPYMGSIGMCYLQVRFWSEIGNRFWPFWCKILIYFIIIFFSLFILAMFFTLAWNWIFVYKKPFFPINISKFIEEAMVMSFWQICSASRMFSKKRNQFWLAAVVY